MTRMEFLVINTPGPKPKRYIITVTPYWRDSMGDSIVGSPQEWMTPLWPDGTSAFGNLMVPSTLTTPEQHFGGVDGRSQLGVRFDVRLRAVSDDALGQPKVVTDNG